MTDKKDLDSRFLALLQERIETFFMIGNYVIKNEISTSRRFDFSIMQEILLLEIFLDNHGSRTNKKYAYFTELVATIRNLANIMYFSKHVIERIPIYQIEESKKNEQALFDRTEEFYLWALLTMRKLYNAVTLEAHSLGLKTPTGEFEVKTHKMGPEDDFQLEYNIEIDEVELGVKRILELTNKYRKVARAIQRENFGKRYKPKDLPTLIPLRVDEKKARKFQNILHGVQSDYDTYVRGSSEEQQNPNLKRLKGYISISMHLLEIVSWMSHICERHLCSIRTTPVKERIAEIIGAEELLQEMVLFGMNNANKYLMLGNDAAEKILTFYSNPISMELPVPKPIGFHARPSHYISLIVNEFGTDVFLIFDGHEYSCKSVMMLLQAGAEISEAGLETVTFKGDEKVLNDLKILAENNYCEDSDIPPALNYLRIARNFL